MLAVAQTQLHAQGTAFTYQGRLNSSGGLASGSYDLAFTVFDTNAPAGILVARPGTNSAVAVSNGLFTVTLDFGAGIFTGPDRWLEMAVRTNGAVNFTTLAPRQQITPTPYAIMANSASNLLGTLATTKLTGTFPASQLSGTIPAANISGTYGNAVSFNNGADTFSGSFFGQFFGSSFTGGIFTGQFLGDGSGLTGLWRTGGNAGTTAGNQFLGTTDNQPLEIKVNNTRVFRLEPDSRGASAGNAIGGFIGNAVEQPGSGGDFIGSGGYPGIPNLIHSNSSGVFIGSGSQNQVGPNVNDSSILGGYGQTILSSDSVISGGSANTISSNSPHATISGGYNQNILADSYQATIGGGSGNMIQTNSPWSTIAGGTLNTIEIHTGGALIGGGYHNSIQADSYQATIGGGYQNTVQTNSTYATIGGGRENLIGASASYAIVGGGYHNVEEDNTDIAVIAGGFLNTIQSNNWISVIGGGQNNVIKTNGTGSVIAGGYLNSIGSSVNPANYIFGATIGGGYLNSIGDYSGGAIIGGGSFNIIQASSPGSIIGGGNSNTNGGINSFIGGGVNNLIQSNSQSATIPGGYKNAAGGNYSFAAGCYAQATNDGAFVWADSSSANAFGSTSTNQFLVRATGGVKFTTAGAGVSIDGQPIFSGNNGSGLNGVNAATLVGLLPSAFAPANGSTSYIQNQNGGPQAATFNISGNATVGALQINAGAGNLELASGGLKVTGAGIGSSTAVFVHRATGANIEPGFIHRTTINNPYSNGDPNAILIVTPNYNPSGTGNVLQTHQVGVFYNSPLSKWQIFNEDIVALSTNTAFNVMIVKP